jgi:uncharacterized protein RhaS with RHS repeats
MYDPTIGRWLSEDPIGFEAGDANKVRYVGNGPINATDPSGLAKTQWYKGLKILVDHNTLELVLKNGKRLKIRNGKFINCDVSLNDIDELTTVGKDRIQRMRAKYGNDLTIKFDEFAQPDLSRFVLASQNIPNPNASNYADQAWSALKLENRKLFNKLSKKRFMYHWHHAPDGSLHLVDRDLHGTYQHTGLNAILNKLGGVCCLLIPGAESLSQGQVSDAGRELAVEGTPLGIGMFLTQYFNWLFDSAWDDVYGDGAQKVKW